MGDLSPGPRLVDDPGEGQIHQNGPKAHGQQQRRLKALFNGQPDEQPTHNVHHQLLGGDGENALP